MFATIGHLFDVCHTSFLSTQFFVVGASTVTLSVRWIRATKEKLETGMDSITHHRKLRFAGDIDHHTLSLGPVILVMPRADYYETATTRVSLSLSFSLRILLHLFLACSRTLWQFFPLFRFLFKSRPSLIELVSPASSEQARASLTSALNRSGD